MMNFQFKAAYLLLVELSVLIRVSHHNMRVLGTIDLYQKRSFDDYDEKNKHVEVMSDCVTSARAISSAVEKNSDFYQSKHIDEAAVRLKCWANGKNPEWSELNMHARATQCY